MHIHTCMCLHVHVATCMCMPQRSVRQVLEPVHTSSCTCMHTHSPTCSITLHASGWHSQKEKYGLSFITLHSPPSESGEKEEEEKKATPTKKHLGAFTLKEEPKNLQSGDLCVCVCVGGGGDVHVGVYWCVGVHVCAYIHDVCIQCM